MAAVTICSDFGTLQNKVCHCLHCFPIYLPWSDGTRIDGWRIDAFELWCWRRLLRVPWAARRPNQFILKEIIPDYSLEGLMLTLKLRYFGHLFWRTDSLEKTLMLGRLKAGGQGDDRGWDGWMSSPTQWKWVWVNSGSWWWTGRPGVLQSKGSQRVIGHDWVTELNWWDQTPWSYLSECWALSQLFHSPLSLSSRGSLVLHFLP